MSAWVIGLGLSAGYLINKNLAMDARLQETVKEHNQSAKPATDGPPTEEIRQVQRSLPIADRYQDMNLQDLSRQDADALAKEQEAQHQSVSSYEASLPQIEGVYLSFDRHGV